MGSLPAYPGGGSTMIGPSSTTMVTGSTSAMASGRTQYLASLPADTRRDLTDRYTAVLAETADAVRLNEARDVQRGTGMAITDAAHSGNGRRAIRIIAIRICTSIGPRGRAHAAAEPTRGHRDRNLLRCPWCRIQMSVLGTLPRPISRCCYCPRLSRE